MDLITIITPHNTHAPLALQALKAGRHVVCEKPMAIKTAECDAMITGGQEEPRGALDVSQSTLGRADHERRSADWIGDDR